LAGGGNQDQPPPFLTSGLVLGHGLTLLTGVLSGLPRTTYQVEFFASRSGGPGNGQILLGIVDVGTDAAGFGQFSVFGLTAPDAGLADFFTATATSPAGNTSVFSPPLKAARASRNG
jgi:hypothetical protein